MPLFVDPDLEIRQVEQAQARRAKLAKPSANAAQAALLERWSQQAPWMKGAAALQLAKWGVTPESAQGRKIMRAGAVVKGRSGLGFGRIGDVVKAGARHVARGAKIASGAVAEAVDDVVGENVENAIGSGVKPVVRSAFTGAQSLYETGQGVVRNVAATGPVGAAVAGGVTAAALAATAPVSVPALGIAAIGAGGAALAARASQDIEGTPDWNPLNYSSGGIALQQAVAGEKVDLGSGFLPAGSTVSEQRVRSRNVTIDGRSLTPGRLLAAGVVEPGSREYNALSGVVDMGTALGLDPAAAGLKAAGRANRARKVFSAAGAVAGNRRMTIPEQVESWLNSSTGRRVVKAMVDETDFDALWKATSQKIDVKTILKIADATSEAEVLSILKPQLGVEILDRPTIARLPQVRKRIDGVRLLQAMPGHHIDPGDIDDAVRQLDRFQKNVKLAPEVIARNNRLMAEAENPTQVYDVLINKVIRDSVNPKLGKTTKVWANYHKEYAKYFVDEIGENVGPLGVTVDDIPSVLPSPHLYVEYLNRSIPLPDARELRRASSRIGKFMDDHPSIDTGVALGDWFMQDAWKPITLLRGAWTVRVVGEEQIRMAAAGLDSMVSHPLSRIAQMVGTKSGRIENIGIKGDLLSESEEGLAALSRGSAGFRGDRNLINTRYKTIYERGAQEYGESLGGELAQLHADPFARRLVAGLGEGDGVATRTGNPLIDVKEWGFNGTGRKLRKEMAAAEGREDLLTREGWDAYIDSVQRRIQIKTGDNGDLLELVRNGKFAGPDDVERAAGRATGKLEKNSLVRAADRENIGTIRSIDGDSATVHFVSPQGAEATVRLPLSDLTALPAGSRATVSGGIDPKIAQRLQRMGDEGIGPDKVKGNLNIRVKGTPGSKVGEKWDRATETLFNSLMSRPTNYLSRSPAFRQFYWQRIEDLLPSMDEVAKAKALERATKAGLPDRTLEALRKAATRPGVEGRAVSLDLADDIAKGHGLDKTRELLYDLNEKSQFFDVNRLIFPFGEAWKELLTRWAKLGVENPAVLRRAQQTVEGARGAGFFYENEFGEEVFAYPGSAFLNDKLLGVPVPFTGRVAGLSLMTEVMPGVGPLVQIPAGTYLPETPEWQWARNILLPFGEKDADAGVLESQFPAWLQKFRTSGLLKNVPLLNVVAGTDETQERLLNNTAMDLLAFEVSAGKRPPPGSLEEIQAAVEDNMDKARWLYFIRGSLQFGAPTAPTPEQVAADKHGNVLVASRMRADLYDMQNGNKDKGIPKLGYDEGFRAWMEKYGDAAYLLTQPKSRSLTYAAPVTADGLKWAKKNPDLAKEFPNVYGFFAPAGGDLDMEALNRQFRTGEREGIAPIAAVQLANNRVALDLYKQAKDQIGPTPTAADRAWLRDVKAALREEYYGFDRAVVGVGAKVAPDDAIADLQRAVKNRKVQATDAGKGLAVYLKARQRAVDAGATPTSFRTANKHAADREWLRQVADAVIREHPDFEPMWEQLFSGELRDDEVEQ